MTENVRDYINCTGKDEATGFTGICTAYAVFLTGCDRVILEGMDTTGRPVEMWVDVSRVEWLS